MKSRAKIPLLGIFFMAAVLNAQDGLVGYWSFEKLDADTFEGLSKQRNDGYVYGASLGPGVVGNALYLDGKNDYAEIPGKEISVPRAIRGVREGAVSIWFRVDSIPRLGIAPLLYFGNETPCDFYDAANEGLILEVGHSPVHKKSERLYFTIFRDGCTTPSFCFDSNQSIMKGRWYHFVVVVGENYNTADLDGEEMIHRRYNFGGPESSQFFDDAINPERLWLGKGHWAREVQYTRGAIDELKIFYRPLNSNQVESLYLEGTAASSVDQAIASAGSFRVYPNPSNGVIQYEFPLAIEKPGEVRIRDFKRRVVYKRPGLPASGAVDISHLPGGLYTISFEGEGGLLSKKVIVL
jgi:hypothetical protein